ncbi:MAG: hypothetical protein LCH37_10245 [Bacteroidetes bacterium]|nr:hypothetical protein [Bacteroidota bacterium]
MTKQISLIFIFLSVSLNGFSQNQNELPVFALRTLGQTNPNFEEMNPTIAVYKNGVVIFKLPSDSNNELNYYNYFHSKINPQEIDSLLNMLVKQNFFNNLKDTYNPSFEKYGFKFSHYVIELLSINSAQKKSIAIYGGWVENDSLFIYNPKQVKLLYDWLTNLRDSIIYFKNYSEWKPTIIELVREKCNRDYSLKEKCKDSDKIHLKQEFKNKEWIKFDERISKNHKSHLNFEIYNCTNPEEIKYIMQLLNRGKMQTTMLNGKSYHLFYTFGYDIIPFYFDITTQFSKLH